MKILLTVLIMITTFQLWSIDTNFDRIMVELIEDYNVIQKQLADDKTGNVIETAKLMNPKIVELDLDTITDSNREEFLNLKEKMLEANNEIIKATDIESMREAFKKLSRPFVLWASINKPEGTYVMYCSMAKGSWLQDNDDLKNPYYGSSMLKCGEIISSNDQSTEEKNHSGDHKH